MYFFRQSKSLFTLIYSIAVCYVFEFYFLSEIKVVMSYSYQWLIMTSMAQSIIKVGRPYVPDFNCVLLVGNAFPTSYKKAQIQLEEDKHFSVLHCVITRVTR